jgi:uncharacterized membrane protein
MNIKVSVIIILYNDPGIAQTIEGINNQKCPFAFEVIIVDKSTIEYGNLSRQKNIQWIFYENTDKKYTIPEQRNLGIRASTGEIIAYIDANCIPTETWLRELVMPIINGEEKIVAGKTGSIGKETLNDDYYQNIASYKYLKESPTINLAIHKEVFRKIGYFDESYQYGSDVDFTWRAVKSGYRIRYVPSAYIQHDWGDAKNEIKRAFLYGKARMKLLLKHWRSHWKNAFTSDSPAILYPTLILILPIYSLFPWTLLPLPLLVLKNYKKSRPLETVLKHYIYGLGSLNEVIAQTINSLFQLLIQTSKAPLSYYVGFTILTLILAGLLQNTIFAQFGILDPLSKNNTNYFYIALLPLFLKLSLECIRWMNQKLFFLPFTFLLLLNPFIAFAGATYLDNTNNAALAIASVLLTSSSFIITYLFGPRSNSLYKPTLYFIALSTLVANTARSNYLVGWDIHQEYYVFRLTNFYNYWNINAFKDAYNACLSITILPTIVHNLTGLEPIQIMKFFYPLVISFLPVIVFQIGSKLTNQKLAYIGAFAFLLQSQFISQLPALARQGIAFVFFALMIDVLLTKRQALLRTITFTLFGIGMIFSHYSTTYVAIFIFIVGKCIGLLLSNLGRYKSNSDPLSIRSIIFLFAVAFFWNVMITNTTNGLANSVQRVSSSISSIFSLENKSDVVKGIAYVKTSNSKLVTDYVERTLEESGASDYFSRYRILPTSLSDGKTYKITDPLPLYFHVIIPWLFRISIVIGFIYVLIFEYRNTKSTLILELSTTMFLITILIAVLPSLSLDYNFERLFQQVLILLAPIGAIGFYLASDKMKRSITTVIICIILLSYFTQTTGLFAYATYGKPTWMFSSIGEQYFRYYTRKEEVAGIEWLDSQDLDNDFMYADKYTKLRLIAYGDRRYSYISTLPNPPEMENYGYVLLGNAAINANVFFGQKNTLQLTFTPPKKFLSDSKNNIYTNGITEVYR